VQLYRRDRANNEEMDSTSDGKQKQTTDEDRVNVDPTVRVRFIFIPKVAAAGIICLFRFCPNAKAIIGTTVKHLSSKK